MRKLQIQYIREPEKRDKEIIDEFVAKIAMLFEKTNCNLNSYVNEDEVSIEEDETRDLLSDALEDSAIVGANVNMEKFFAQFVSWDAYDQMDQFLLWMREYIDERLSAYNETGFIREMGTVPLQQVLEYCFGEYVLVNNVVSDYGEVNEGQIKVITKVFRTLIDMVIINNFSYKYTYQVSYGMFLWSNEVYDCFWQLIDDNRDALWKIAIVQKIANLERSIEAFDMKR